MKAILEFDLPTDNDEYLINVQARNTVCVLWDLDQYLRGQLKYNDKLTDEQYKIFEELRDYLHNLLSEYDVRIDL